MKESSSSVNISGRVVRRGAWCEEEDILLRRCIEKFGEGKWRQVPLRAGLNRCGKSCRLRWINYLQPNIKRGEFEVDELDLIMRMRKLLGNRWSIIAGRLPGRTANDVKNCYNTLLKKKCFLKCNGDQAEQAASIKSLRDETNNDGRINVRTTAADDCDDDNSMMAKVIKPLPRRLTNKSKMVTNRASASTGMNGDNNTIIPSIDFDGAQGVGEGGNDEYWNDLYFDYDSWGALGEEKDQHLLSSNDDLLY